MAKIPGFGIYDDVTDHCPECGAFLDRNFDTEVEGNETVDYTTCQGDSPHRWRILKLHRDRSVWNYRLSGPISEKA